MSASQSGLPQAWLTTRPKVKDAQLGPLLRMHPIPATHLPAHPDLQGDHTGRPDLASFVGGFLEEAYPFATTYLLSKFKTKAENKDASPATAKVKQLAHEIDVTLPDTSSKLTENWFARISVHENAVKDGTASWEEFDAGLRQDHAVHEKDYTPDLKDAHLVFDYGSQLSSLQGSFGEWQEVFAEVREMVHQLPPPLTKRCFSVMVISAKKNNEFIDIQLPLDLHGVSKAEYVDSPSITVGTYVSVEYGKLIENGAKVEWRMAVASDAGGTLPMWAQKLGLPGAIVKDVGLFMDWRMKQRSKGL